MAEDILEKETELEGQDSNNSKNYLDDNEDTYQDGKSTSYKDGFLYKEGDSCPKCGAKLVLRQTQRGDFLGCSNFPECDFVYHLGFTTLVRILATIDKQCPICGQSLEVKKGRFGIFVGCSNYPNCDYVLTVKDDLNIKCPVCQKGHIVKKHGSLGKEFYACDNYPDCKFSLNGKPVVKTCSVCGFPLMFEKKSKQGIKIVCANSLCKSRPQRKVRARKIELLKGEEQSLLELQKLNFDKNQENE